MLCKQPIAVSCNLVSIFNGDRLVADHGRLHGFRYQHSTDPAHNPNGVIHGVEVLTRDELLKRASSFGPATTQVITQILERNEKAFPSGLHTARKPADIDKVADAVFIRPATHYDQFKEV